MAVTDQVVGERYAIYHADACEVLPQIPDDSIHLSIYSPPFGGLYHYSSSERDLSNCRSYEEFFEHYAFIVREMARITMPGRLSVVHVKDVPRAGVGRGDGLRDFPGDVIRLHEQHGWLYHDRKAIWKEPLREAIRTRSLGLRHSQIVKDATACRSALADHLVVFKRRGANPVPVEHPTGLSTYAGDWQAPPRPRAGVDVDLSVLQAKYAGWTDQKTNKLSHWIWQRYASAFWDDIRVGRVLAYRNARESDEEKHVHPLQLDVIERCVILWSNPGETVLTPFMGVGSEVYAALVNGRKAVGVEIKASYFRQARQNIDHAMRGWSDGDPLDLFVADTPEAT